MRNLIVLMMVLLPFSSFAGVGGGGVGPRPTNFLRQSGVDLVRTLEINNGMVKFLYKPFDQQNVMVKTVDLNVINDLYKAALADSQQARDWMAVPLKVE